MSLNYSSHDFETLHWGGGSECCLHYWGLLFSDLLELGLG